MQATLNVDHSMLLRSPNGVSSMRSKPPYTPWPCLLAECPTLATWRCTLYMASALANGEAFALHIVNTCPVECGKPPFGSLASAFACFHFLKLAFLKTAWHSFVLLHAQSVPCNCAAIASC